MSSKRPRPQNRLTPQQVSRRIELGQQLLARTGFKPANDKIVGEFERLGLFLYEEQFQALVSVFSEISCDCYVGPHPPNHLSREPKTSGKRMLGFVWNSPSLGGRLMYFKFCIQKFRDEETLFVFSVHESFGSRGD